MGTTKVKAIELVIDWNLWPRQSAQKLDSTNLARMKASLRAGFAMPPILVNRADNRVVDGFHRTRAVMDVFGDDGKLDVIYKDYDSDAAMFLEAGATNHHHGLPMSPKDRAHFIAKCRKLKIPWPAIADALSSDAAALKEFVKKRTAKTEAGGTVPLAAGAMALAGKTLTPAQEHFAKTANGCMPEMYISMLLNALRGDGVVLTDRTLGRLRELHSEIGVILDEAA